MKTVSSRSLVCVLAAILFFLPVAMRAQTAGPAAAALGGSGVLTKQQVLGYARANGYVNGVPRRDQQLCRVLVQEIKRRGIEQPLAYGPDDLTALSENGCNYGTDTDVVRAALNNTGAPVTEAWLGGTWYMWVTGGTVDTARSDGYIHRQNETAATSGFLTINSGGTFTWKVGPVDPPSKYLHGSWRRATASEMGIQGGAGIVLQNGDKGRDWIVFKYADPNVANKAERIEVEDMQLRGGMRQIGWRH